MVNLFLIIPESNPQYNWMQSNDRFQDENQIVIFVQELESKLETIKLESFVGFYDSENMLNFLSDFKDVEDYYPNPAFRSLRAQLRNWNNWRDQMVQESGNGYLIYNQRVESHTFCECFQRSIANEQLKASILNHHGHSLGNKIHVLSNAKNKAFDSIETGQELTNWFARERVPARNFQAIPKHGENRPDQRSIKGELISPLRCSQEQAQILLNTAIGGHISELYNFDADHNHYIVFKFEGNNPQNMYHGYHVPMDTTEVPNDIKTKLRSQHGIK